MKKMKRILLVVLLISLTLSCVACGCKHEEVIDAAVSATCTESGLTEGKHCSVCNKVLTKQKEVPALGHSEVIVEAVAASCTAEGSTEGKKCATCGEVLVAAEKIPALGHTTDTGVCSRCNLSMGLFAVDYYVDEFNQPTKDGYVSNITYFLGTFSNSATTDSELLVTLLADKDDIAFVMYEYGRNQVKNASNYSVDKYDITMKTAGGEKQSLKGTVYCGGDRLFINDKYKSIVLTALCSGENVSFYIEKSDRTTTQYLFTVNSSNFAEEYAKLK